MQIIKVVHQDHGCTLIDNKTLEDSRLSWKARGLLAYLLSRPDNWKVNAEHLSAQSIDGPKAVRSGLDELRKVGYAKLDVGGGGKGGSGWVIFESPELNSEMNKTGISDCSEMNKTGNSGFVELGISVSASKNNGNKTARKLPFKGTSKVQSKGFKALTGGGTGEEENALFNLFEYFTKDEISAYGANWRLRYRECPDKFRRVVADLHAEKQEGRKVASYAAIANIRWNEFKPETKR